MGNFNSLPALILLFTRSHCLLVSRLHLQLFLPFQLIPLGCPPLPGHLLAGNLSASVVIDTSRLLVFCFLPSSQLSLESWGALRVLLLRSKKIGGRRNFKVSEKSLQAPMSLFPPAPASSLKPSRLLPATKLGRNRAACFVVCSFVAYFFFLRLVRGAVPRRSLPC